jgi:ABC-type phosphate transport system permease subunit
MLNLIKANFIFMKTDLYIQALGMGIPILCLLPMVVFGEAGIFYVSAIFFNVLLGFYQFCVSNIRFYPSSNPIIKKWRKNYIIASIIYTFLVIAFYASQNNDFIYEYRDVIFILIVAVINPLFSITYFTISFKDYLSRVQ